MFFTNHSKLECQQYPTRMICLVQVVQHWIGWLNQLWNGQGPVWKSHVICPGRGRRHRQITSSCPFHRYWMTTHSDKLKATILHFSKGGVPDVHKMCPQTIDNKAFYMGKSTPWLSAVYSWEIQMSIKDTCYVWGKKQQNLQLLDVLACKKSLSDFEKMV